MTRTFKTGDVVNVNWPFSDGSESKIRPAVVVSRSWVSEARQDYVVARISGNAYGSDADLSIRGQEREYCGLSKDCFVVACQLYTIHESAILNRRGSFPPKVLAKLYEKLRLVFFEPSPTSTG